jgi:hypothetical protein
MATIPRQKIEAHRARQRYSHYLHVESVFLVLVGKAYVITAASSSDKTAKDTEHER